MMEETTAEELPEIDSLSVTVSRLLRARKLEFTEALKEVVKVELDHEETVAKESLEVEVKSKKLESRLDYETHPMQSDTILEKIFASKSLTVSDLKNYRLVCKQWRDACLDRWRREALLCCKTERVETKNCTTNYAKLFSPVETEKEEKQEAWKAIRASIIQKPFQSYCISSSDDLDAVGFSNIKFLKLRSYSGDYEAIVTKVLGRLPTLEELSLEQLRFKIPEKLIINMIRGPCRKLKRLTITDDDCADSQRSYGHTYSWTQFLAYLPNLESLRIVCDFHPAYSFYHGLTTYFADEFMNALKGLRAQGKLSRLSVLEIFDHSSQPLAKFPINISQILEGCALPLERLSLTLGLHCEAQVIKNLLECHANTLEYLHLVSSSVQRAELEEWYGCKEKEPRWKDLRLDLTIRLEKLKEFRMDNGLFWGLELLSCLVLPDLQKLIMGYDPTAPESQVYGYPPFVVKYFEFLSQPKNETRFLCRMKRMSLPKLETFEFHPIQQLLGLSIMKMLVMSMPNLIHLTIALGGGSFLLVCEHLPKLKSLTVLEASGDYELITEEAITGLKEEETPNSVPPNQRPPNLTNLKEITRLVIPYRRAAKRNELKFTDQSVYHGFLQLPKLLSLSVAFKKISDEARLALEKHVDFLSIPEPEDLKVDNGVECYADNESYPIQIEGDFHGNEINNQEAIQIQNESEDEEEDW